MRRAAAYVVDLVPFTVIKWFPLGVVGDDSGWSWAILLVGDATYLAYRNVGTLTQGKWSLGKRLMGLRIQSVGRRPLPSLRQAFLRDVYLVVVLLASTGLAPLFESSDPNRMTAGIGLFWVAVWITWGIADVLVALNHPGRSLHDFLADTAVIRASAAPGRTG